MSLTKKQLAESISEQASLPRNRALAVVESLLELMKATLESGEDILISRFGKFCVNDKNSRGGRNPQTGEALNFGCDENRDL